MPYRLLDGLIGTFFHYLCGGGKFVYVYGNLHTSGRTLTECNNLPCVDFAALGPSIG